MTKVLKLRVLYDGYYGGYVDETTIFPLDVNGVLFPNLEKGEYEEVVSLGEIEGKHSDCYGDLTVEVIDLNELSIKQANELIYESEINYIDNFFEGASGDWYFDSDEEEKENEENIFKLLERYGVDKGVYKWKQREEIYEAFMKELKNKYQVSFSQINVKTEDLEKALKHLENAGIEVFE